MSHKHLTQTAYAKSKGLSRQRISALKKQGRVVMVEVEGRKGLLVDVEATDTLLAASISGLPHHQARRDQFSSVDQPPEESEGKEGTGMTALAQAGLELKIAQKRKAVADAEKAEMESEQLRGHLVPLDQINGVLRDAFTVLRAQLEGLPDRHSTALAAESDEGRVHSLLMTEIEATLSHSAQLLSESVGGANV